MSVTLRALSALLHYPDADLKAAIREIRSAITAEQLLDARQMARLEPLLFQLAGGDLLSLQEAYVELFDRGRVHSLHLFEHVHGESRDRGQAMVELRDRYLDAGLGPASNELPDYLPLFLEYCSILPLAEAREQLAEPGVILAALADRLEARGTPYAAVLALLCEIAGIERTEETASIIAPPDDPDDLEKLDEVWEEETVTFGAMAPQAPGAPCPQASAMLNRMLEPQSPISTRAASAAPERSH